MRDNRYAQGSAPYESDGYARSERGRGDFQQPGYEYDTAGEADQSSGFTKYQPSNSRRMAAENPVVQAARHVGGAVSGLFSRASRPDRSGQPVRPEANRDAGDYLGVGFACRSCGNPVDETQTRCPHCGAFVRPLYLNPVFWVSVVAAVLCVVGLTLAINSCKPVAGPGNDPAVGEAGLASAVQNAQSTLAAQVSARAYTRYSLNGLTSALSEASAVLDNEKATDDQISQAIQKLGDATSALTPLLGGTESYPWPGFGDLSTNSSSYMGKQIAVNGTVQDVGNGADGAVSLALAVEGDPSMIVYVNFTASDAAAIPTVGNDCNAYGVVIGVYNDMPVVYADIVEIV